MYQVNKYSDLCLLSSLLFEKHPDSHLEVKTSSGPNGMVYSVKVKSGLSLQPIIVPIDLKMTVIYGDTDSIFIQMTYDRNDHEHNRLDTFRVATIAGSKLTNEVFNRKPIEMEFEKVFQPFVLLTKKRYIGCKFEDTRNPLKMKEMTTAGIALTRRDYCGVVKNCYSQVIDSIMQTTTHSVSQSIDIFKRYVNEIYEYKIDIDDLALSAIVGGFV
jgi:DNA polymerase elongation subunit (family B)